MYFINVEKNILNSHIDFILKHKASIIAVVRNGFMHFVWVQNEHRQPQIEAKFGLQMFLLTTLTKLLTTKFSKQT